MSLVSPALAGGFFTTSATWEALHLLELYLFTEDDAVQSERQSVKGLAKIASRSTRLVSSKDSGGRSLLRKDLGWEQKLLLTLLIRFFPTVDL